MKKYKKGIFLALLLPLISIVLSCRKQEFVESPTNELPKKQVISEWLQQHDKNSSVKETVTLDMISESLDYGSMKAMPRKNGDVIITIPVDDGVRKNLNLNERSALKLMIVQSRTGKLRWSTVVSYLPLDDKKKSSLSEMTLQNILNNEPVTDDGEYKFFNVKG